jgi:hypothetical protein
MFIPVYKLLLKQLVGINSSYRLYITYTIL